MIGGDSNSLVSPEPRGVVRRGTIVPESWYLRLGPVKTAAI